MATNWTEEQRAAIETKNHNLLLSAAAGSGKTAVLVGRIIERLTDKENPILADRLLVVTFTNAAAAEMRERIISALSDLTEKNPNDSFLQNQLVLAKKAQITTIDSFCIDVLRNHFAGANLSPDFKIADPTENSLMRDEVLDEVITEMYDDEVFADDFFLVLESYANSKANDTAFRELIHSIYNFSMSLPNPKEWLRDAAEEFNKEKDFNNTIWCHALLKEAKEEIEAQLLDYDTMKSFAREDNLLDYETHLLEEGEMIKGLLNFDCYDDLKCAIENITYKNRPKKPKDFEPRFLDTINDMREKNKKRLKKTFDTFFNLTSYEQGEAILKSYPLMRCVSEIVIRLIDKFLEAKLNRNVIDFSDCEHMCLELLVDENGKLTQTANEIKNKYDEIYIDEYQDTSRLQEAIFSAIKKEDNLFMVGDIKQSIYRFRNTEPTLFKAKRELYMSGESEKDRLIILSKNFRSRENVLNSVNYIFERVMSEKSGEIEYDDTEKLYYGANFPDDAVNPVDTKCDVCIIDVSSVEELSEDDETEKTYLQAQLTAKKIAELIKSRAEIFDKGIYRPIKYSDICIISRNTKSSAPILVSVLSELGIPCFSENTGEFLESIEITTMLSILSVIDNPVSDIPLLAVLRSIIFGLSSDELANIRCADKKSSFYDALIACSHTDTPEGAISKNVLMQINDFREKSKYMSVSDLILEIYNKTGFYDAQRTQPNGEIRQANLRLLYSRAKEYEKTAFKGLYSFVRFINDYSASGSDFDAAKVVGSEQDAVRIMSIHKSKGLEFPVVILFGAEHKFNMQDLSKGILYHAEYGFGPKFVDTDLRITYPFAPRVALSSVLKRESIAEEMRILYVAMTRAKEKLIIIGSEKNLKAKINSLSNSGNERKISNIKSLGNSYLDWIIASLINHPDGKPLRDMCDLSKPVIEDNSRFLVEIYETPESVYMEENETLENEQIENFNIDPQILKTVFYEYPNMDDTHLPSKITVTELKRKVQDTDTDAVYLFKPERKLKRSTKLTSAEIGTAYHTVMQHIDLSGKLECREDVVSQINIIKDKGLLTNEEAGAINPEKILKFFLSNTGKLIKSAKKVKREVMFGIERPAKTLLPEFKSEKNIMLQGVIDCVAETDDGLIIIDYKTDKTYNDNDTVEKYKIQLECYSMAAETIFKKKVILKILYLFDSDMGITI